MRKICIKQKDYDDIKRGKSVLIMIETKREPAIYACIRSYKAESSSDSESRYENAKFNGEVD